MNIIGIRQKLTQKTKTTHQQHHHHTQQQQQQHCDPVVVNQGGRPFYRIMPHTPQTPRKEGVLMKYRNVWSGWAQRYFKLERTYLHYFETRHTHTPLQTITRGEIANVKTSTQFPDKPNAFEIHLKNGTVWYCQASSSDEMIDWMRVLSTAPILVPVPAHVEEPAEPFECISVLPVNIQYHPTPGNTQLHPTYPIPAEEGCSMRSTTPSPYKEIHNTAHDVAHHHGYHTHADKDDCCPDTPPPPYSEHDDNGPPKFPRHYPK